MPRAKRTTTPVGTARIDMTDAFVGLHPPTYDVVCDDSLAIFIQRVNERLVEGWKLQGGMAVRIDPETSFRDSHTTYYQAFVKEGA